MTALLVSLFVYLFCWGVGAHRAPHSFPTRRSSDLLTNLASDAAVRLKARVMEERLWLHGLLHYHAPSGRHAGPHARAYHAQDRKSTRLNSSHLVISYAVVCLEKKKK